MLQVFLGVNDLSDNETAESLWPQRIDKEALNQLPRLTYMGKVEIVSTPEAAERACAALMQERVLGFDTETRPAFTKGESFLPALTQLAGEQCVYLFQHKLMGTIAPLLPIFSNSEVMKVGVALHDDIKGLQQIESFEARGFVELSQFTTPLGIINTGLRPLCGIFLGGRISKGAQVSNWARTELQQAQITYAATDAWVSRELFLKLESLGYVRSPAIAETQPNKSDTVISEEVDSTQ